MEKTDVPFKGKKNVATEELSEGERIFLMKSKCFVLFFLNINVGLPLDQQMQPKKYLTNVSTVYRKQRSHISSSCSSGQGNRKKINFSYHGNNNKYKLNYGNIYNSCQHVIYPLSTCLKATDLT